MPQPSNEGWDWADAKRFMQIVVNEIEEKALREGLHLGPTEALGILMAGVALLKVAHVKRPALLHVAGRIFDLVSVQRRQSYKA